MTTRCHRQSERGSATIWVLALCLVLWGAALAGGTVGAALVARHRAESAADLAALAAARAAVTGTPDSCGRAQLVVAPMKARLVGCRAEADGSVTVLTEVALPGLIAGWADMPPARARARAGGMWSVGGEER